jgi:Kef-type K+ transport system membrane component KefB
MFTTVSMFLFVLVLLVVSRAGGEIAERLKQPAIAGALVVGVLLGILANVPDTPFSGLVALNKDDGLKILVDFAIFFLMLHGGIELQPREVFGSSGRSITIALGGFLLPLAAGFATVWFFAPPSDARFLQAAFVGVALAITAVPVTIKILLDLRVMHTPVGNATVAAALVDAIVSILLLAILTGLVGAEGGELTLASLWPPLLRALAFVAIAAVVAKAVLPWVYHRLISRMRVEENEFSALLIVALVFAFLAELFGLHFILGPFFAGLFFGQRDVSKAIFEDVQGKVGAITTGFLAPLFFVSIGLHTDISTLSATPLFFAILLSVAFFAKIVGSAVPARLGGFDKRDALAIGVGMSGRGAVELVVADIALRSGIFSSPESSPIIDNMFGSIVLVAVLTTIAAPILLRRTLRA